MSQETSAHSVIKTFKSSGVVHPGHTVDISAAGTVVESTGANTAVGVYIGTANSADGEHIDVCILGPCRAWSEGVLTLNPNQYVSNDATGHIAAETTNNKRCLGMTLEAMASGTGYVEILVAPCVYGA
jgi:hypothetical protein